MEWNTAKWGDLGLIWGKRKTIGSITAEYAVHSWNIALKWTHWRGKNREPKLCLLWKVESTRSFGLWCNMWAELKINIQVLPGNWDNSHSWSVISIQAREAGGCLATCCVCLVMTSNTGPHSVLRKISQKPWRWTYRATRQVLHFHYFQTPVFQFFSSGMIIILWAS